ncbi:outer dynein arm-docking complex subunit 1-like, partial [Synchiropus picturatus]
IPSGPLQTELIHSIKMDKHELDLTRMQRQFRVMEREQQSYTAQARERIRRQKQEIETLQREQRELNDNLGACRHVAQQQKEKKVTDSLQQILETLEKERLLQQEIKKEVSDVERKLAEQRKGKVSTTEEQRNQARRTQKALRTAENKLDRALTKLHEQQSKGRNLKGGLQSLLIERDHFQLLRNKLEKELQDVRVKIKELIKLSTAAYDARLEAQARMNMMREKAEKDLEQYNAEMKELQVTEHEFNLKEFKTTKCREMSSQEAGHGQLSDLEEQREMEPTTEMLESLEEAFTRILVLTKADNLDIVATRFIQVEDRNFALFNYVNEQATETEAVKDQISQMQVEMKQFEEERLQQKQNFAASLADIDLRLKESTLQAEDDDAQSKVMSELLSQIITGLSNVLSNVECGRSSLEDKLGFSSGINENNIMSYLSLVEQKTNELLSIQAFLHYKGLTKDYNPRVSSRFLHGQNPETSQEKVDFQGVLKSLETDHEDSPVTDGEHSSGKIQMSN